MRKFRLFFLFLMVSCFAQANLRTDAEICRLASDYLSFMYATEQVSAIRRAPTSSPKILLRHDLFSITGYQDGGFVLVCADEAAPAIWGYSEGQAFDTLPDNMACWLSEMSKMIRQSQQPLRTLGVPQGLKEEVLPMLSSKWGQNAPYNFDITPSITGCCATAMAQIMYYYRYPKCGLGQHSYIYNRLEYSIDFSVNTLDWDNMRDVYKGKMDLNDSTSAVAVLMAECGYSIDMQYGTEESGAYTLDMAAALRNYFGYSKHTRSIPHKMYSDEQWQEILFTELSEGRPVSYGAKRGVQDINGHQFVIDGYDNQGNVHVNWGWNGLCDGYYAITNMNPLGETPYSTSAEMVIGIQPETEQLYHKSVTLTKSGTLCDSLTGYDMTHLQSLKIAGNINGKDISTIRALMGFGINMGTYTGGQLTALDMEDANIYTDAGNIYFMQESTPIVLYYNHTLPMAFATDVNLTTFAGLTELILPKSLTAIADYAMPKCGGLTSIAIPAGVTSIGQQAFFDTDKHLRTIISYAERPPLWQTAFVNDVVFREATVYVPKGALTAYQQDTSWKKFKHIVELDDNVATDIRAKHTNSEYATKRMQDGRLIIEYHNIQYNAQGQRIAVR